jgi:hypothetical protein
MALEYFDSKGREIRTEVIDGVTRQSFVTNANANEYVTDRQMTGPQDLQSCINDKRWSTDPAFREATIAAARQAGEQGVNMNLGSSDEVQVLEKAMDGDSGKREESIAMQREGITVLFGDPRYKTSPTFRAYVMEQIRLSDPRHMQTMPSGSYSAPAQITGRFAPEPKRTEETQK